MAYERGADIDWAQFDAPYQRAYVPVPAYAFSHRRYWLKHVPVVEAGPPSGDAAPSRRAVQRKRMASSGPGPRRE